jgi:hypothetical protein
VLEAAHVGGGQPAGNADPRVVARSGNPHSCHRRVLQQKGEPTCAADKCPLFFGVIRMTRPVSRADVGLATCRQDT